MKRLEKIPDNVFMINMPIGGAEECEALLIDRRATSDSSAVPGWFMSGTNHRVENGRITRDIGWYPNWFVQVDDIVAFSKQHGRIEVVYNEQYGCMEIEIP